MPCDDGSRGYDSQRLAELTQEAGRLRALVCAILSVLDRAEKIKMFHNSVETVFNSIDWYEAGITKKWAERWWAQHKKEDAERREAERRERIAKRKRRKLRAKALGKLSSDERVALGFDPDLVEKDLDG